MKMPWTDRQDADQALDEEIRGHFAMAVADRIARGESPDEALAAIKREFGNVGQVKELTRETWGGAWFERMMQDLRYALRTLRRSPAFTIVVVLSLGLGVGANTAIFTLIDAVMVRDLPVTRPRELVAIGDPSLVNAFGEGAPHSNLFSYPLYRDVRDHGRLFTGVLAAGRTGRLDVLVDRGSELEHPQGRFVSGNYFSVLGVSSFRGHVFDGAEDRVAASSPIAVISYGYWTRRFHRDPSAIAKRIVVDNTPITIVGVTPPSFTGDVVGAAPDMWLPVSMSDVMRPHKKILDNRKESWLLLLGRLAPGVTLEHARQDLTPFILHTIVANASAKSGSEFMAGKPEVFVGPGNKGFSEVRATYEMPLFTLMTGVALLLCIICANVANLLLARAVARGKEVAVRLALGADRGRLVRQLLTENLVLAGLGAAVGLLIAAWGSRGLLALAADGSDVPLDLTLDGRVLAFTLVVSIAAVMLFGLVPALKASRVDYGAMLRANARTLTSGGLGHRGKRVPLAALLIAGQVALSVVLLVGAAMLSRSLRAIQSVDVGLDRDHLVVADVDVTSRGYARERLTTLTHTLRDRLAALPGVKAATYSENGIFSGTEWHTSIEVPGFVARSVADSEIAEDNAGAGYAQGIGARLIAGRDIAASDEINPGYVALVNASFARFYFPNADAVGKYFHLHQSIAVRIIGVIADTRDHALTRAPDRRAYWVYVPTDTALSDPSALKLIVRTTGDPAAMVGRIRKAIAAVDPLLPVDRIAPLPVSIRASIREERLVANLSSAFGLLALLLASIGLYGVMTYAVTRRTAEMGLRAALGAQRRDVLALVLSDAARLVGIGIVVGVPIALASARLLRGQLYGVASADPWSIVTALLVLSASAAIAALVPAARASRVSPLVAMQAD